MSVQRSERISSTVEGANFLDSEEDSVVLGVLKTRVQYKHGYFQFLKKRQGGSSLKQYIINSEDQWQALWPEFEKELFAFPYLGLDVEGFDESNYLRELRSPVESIRNAALSVPPTMLASVRQKRPLLLQLSTLSGLTALVRIGMMEELPATLKNLLENRAVMKVGVSIMTDKCWLFSGFGVVLEGAVDLRHIAEDVQKRVPNEISLTYRMGLKSLAQQYMGYSVRPFTLAQMKRLAWSNWAQKTLTDSQEIYAVFDSQVAIDIFGVSAEKLCPNLKLTEAGRFPEGFDARLLQSHVDKFVGCPYISSIGGSSADNDYDMANFDISPNQSDCEEERDAKERLLSKKARKCYKKVTDLVFSCAEAEMTGYESVLRSIFRPEKSPLKIEGVEEENIARYDGGRLPVLARKATAYLSEESAKGKGWVEFLESNNGRLFGYNTAIGQRLRRDRWEPFMCAKSETDSGRVESLRKRFRKIPFFRVHLLKLRERAVDSVFRDVVGYRKTFPLYSKFHDFSGEEQFREIMQYEVAGRLERTPRKLPMAVVAKFGNRIEYRDMASREEKMSGIIPSPFYFKAVENQISSKYRSLVRRNRIKDAIWAEIIQIYDAKQEKNEMEMIERTLLLNEGYLKLQDGRKNFKLQKVLKSGDNAGTIMSTLSVDILRRNKEGELSMSLPKILRAGRKRRATLAWAQMCSLESETSSVDHEMGDKRKENRHRLLKHGKLKDLPMSYSLKLLEKYSGQGSKEWVSAHPCWRCGAMNIKKLIWEQVVPAPYIQFVLNCEYECTCNWVLLCLDCAVLWRQQVYSIMLELAAACNASLEVPKFIEIPELEDLERYVAQMRRLETIVDEQRKEWNQLEKERVKGRTAKGFHRRQFSSPDQNSLCHLEGKVLDMVERVRDRSNDQGPCELSASELETFIRTHKYRFNSRCDFHEIKVARCLGWDMVRLERIFRDAMKSFCCDGNGGMFFPTDFSLDHEHDDLPRPWLPGDPPLRPAPVTKRHQKYIDSLYAEISFSTSSDDDNMLVEETSKMVEDTRKETRENNIREAVLPKSISGLGRGILASGRSQDLGGGPPKQDSKSLAAPDAPATRIRGMGIGRGLHVSSWELAGTSGSTSTDFWSTSKAAERLESENVETDHFKCVQKFGENVGNEVSGGMPMEKQVNDSLSAETGQWKCQKYGPPEIGQQNTDGLTRSEGDEPHRTKKLYFLGRGKKQTD